MVFVWIIVCRKGDYNQAIENINKAINLDPKNSTFYFHRGRYNLKLGNMLEAIGDLTEALNSDNCNDVTFTQQLYFHRAEAFIKLSKKRRLFLIFLISLMIIRHGPLNYEVRLI